MRYRQDLPSRYEMRRRGTSHGGLTLGVLVTALMVGGVLVLLAVTFVADWLHTPELTLSATPLILSPNGDHNTGTATYNLSEEDVVTVQVFNEVGGVVRTLITQQLQAAGQHFVVWDARNDLGQPVTDGRYRLQVTAKGTLQTANQSVVFQVDTQAPSLRLVNLPDATRVRDPELTVQGLTEPGATVWVTGNPQPIAVDGQGRFTFQRRLAEGDNQFEVRAVDQAGNSARVTRQLTLVTTPPTVAIATPPEGAWTNQALTNVSGKAPSGSTLKINDQPVPVAADGGFQYDVLLEEGDNTIRIAATDDVGNVTTQQRLVHLKTKPPLVTLSAEDGATYGDAMLQLTGRTDAGATVVVNGQAVPVSTLGDFQATLNLFQGDNAIQVEARDQAGNVTSVTRRVRYNISAPERGLGRLFRNVPDLPSLVVPLLIALPLILLLSLYLLRPVSLELSVDRQAFTPGLPEEGKVLILAVDLNKAARVTLEVLDQYGRPLATVLHDRRRSAGQHHFFWDGYDDYGRPVPPGDYVIQALASSPAAAVTSAVHVSIQEDALIHGRGVTGQRRAGEGGEIIDGRDDFIRRRPRR